MDYDCLDLFATYGEVTLWPLYFVTICLDTTLSPNYYDVRPLARCCAEALQMQALYCILCLPHPPRPRWENLALDVATSSGCVWLLHHAICSTVGY